LKRSSPREEHQPAVAQLSTNLSRTFKGAILGALIAGSLASIDGACIGVLVASGSSEVGPLENALIWAGYVALAGSALGGLLGAALAFLAPRLTLKPPDEGPED
jgi:hypothetical protein